MRIPLFLLKRPWIALAAGAIGLTLAVMARSDHQNRPSLSHGRRGAAHGPGTKVDDGADQPRESLGESQGARTARSARKVGAQEDLSTTRGASQFVSADANALREIVRAGTNAQEVQAAVWCMLNRLRLTEEDIAVLMDRLNRIGEGEAELLKTILSAFALRPDRIPVDHFCRIAEGHERPEVRRAALRTLGTLTDPHAVATVARVARQDSLVQNRQEAVFLLTPNATRGNAADVAREGLAHEACPAVRARWVNLAGVHGSPESIALLESALRSSGEALEVRTLAAEMLAGLDAGRAAELASDGSLPAEIRSHVEKWRNSSGGKEDR